MEAESMEAMRDTVMQQRDERTGALVLIGREEATGRAANVFGNGGFEPVAAARDKEIVYEAVVRHSFNAVAEDDFDDRGEIYLFRLLQWSVGEEGPFATVYMDWQDFIGDEEPGGQYGWDRLLRLGVERMRRVRYEKQTFTPVTVGGEAA